MSKLYTRYTELKKKDPNCAYFFKVGIFYLALAEDAQKLSEPLKLNLGNLNDNIVKISFPVSKLDYYTRLLDALSISFKLIDDTYGTIDNYTDYLNNIHLKKIIDRILSLDFNNITFKESFDILFSMQKDLQKIYLEGEKNKN